MQEVNLSENTSRNVKTKVNGKIGSFDASHKTKVFRPVRLQVITMSSIPSKSSVMERKYLLWAKWKLSVNSRSSRSLLRAECSSETPLQRPVIEMQVVGVGCQLPVKESQLRQPRDTPPHPFLQSTEDSGVPDVLHASLA